MKTIISLTLALPLLLVATPVGLSGCAPRTTTRTDDDAVQTRVERRIAADPDISRYDVDVMVRNGVVTLRGHIDDPAAAQEAVRVVQATEGVTQVVNELTVGDPDRDDADRDDRADLGIRTDVGRRLLAHPDVQRFDININVDDGMVTLSGVVASEEAKRTAEQIAMNVEGVRGVNNVLQVEGMPMEDHDRDKDLDKDRDKDMQAEQPPR
jgi:hyperosmotically inducible periplasmic protein